MEGSLAFTLGGLAFRLQLSAVGVDLNCLRATERIRSRNDELEYGPDRR